jgi:hypothetical protein
MGNKKKTVLYASALDSIMMFTMHLVALVCLVSPGLSRLNWLPWRVARGLAVTGGVNAPTRAATISKQLATAARVQSRSEPPLLPPRIDDATQKVTVVTTASLPWMTGTSVNPLLRAAHLTVDRDEGAVTLMVPWVEIDDQRKLFPNNLTFATQQEQRDYVLNWVAEKANMPTAARKVAAHTFTSSGYDA